ncbi:MAG: LD-carboxypeptidase [Defluviitaleaceae bacterium]|nr:LD-carboxypeptidase [Defluviitaleaceae bacterium]
MIFPKALVKGNKVALVAPSSPVAGDVRLDYALSYVTNLGFDVVVGESCHSSYGHFAGEDSVRAGDINRFFKDTSIHGIFCIRGGNGAGKILDKIDYEAIKKNPKPFFGYSDVSALNIAINQRTQLVTFHTPMFSEPNFADADTYTLSHLERFIFDTRFSGLVEYPENHQPKTLVSGIAEGALCGGNLSCFSATMGTPYEIDTAGKIFFIEDVGINPPRIDRMLNGLRLAGKFDNCAGIIFGDFTNCPPIDPNYSLEIPEILHNLNLNCPAIYNFPCGHLIPTTSLPMGAIVKFDGVSCTLEVL